MSYKEKLNNQFSGIYGGLNAAQREAVDQIEGPVMVIAGPGTGKTQILAARIGKILLETDVYPENILCLTYTEAGTLAMRKRLLSFIGPDAYRVQIFTFHAFCNKVIQENVELFGMRELEPISELEQMEILHEILLDLDARSPLKKWKKDLFHEARQLRSFIQTMKKEAYEGDWLRQKMDEYLKSLPSRDEFIYQRNGKGFVKGDIKKKDIQAVEKRIERSRAAIAVYEQYLKKMESRRRYDFEDMILWVRDAFSKAECEHVLSRYQEQYQYILVDEFQDTSGAQAAVLDALCNYDDSPNVFTVGDDDQSIFRFQGANLGNILQFRSRYPNHRVVVLTDNYRSSQRILDASAYLINHNSQRLLHGKDKELKAVSPLAGSDKSVQINGLINTAQEVCHVALQIRDLITVHAVAPEEIAVLYRNHGDVEYLQKYLAVQKIPFSVRRSEDLLRSGLSGQLLTIMQYVQDEFKHAHSREDLLYQILHFPLFGIESLTAAAIAGYKRLNRSPEQKVVNEWRILLSQIETNDIAKQFQISQEQVGRLKELSVLLEALIGQCQLLTTAQWLDVLIQKSGWLGWLMKQEEKFDLLNELTAFYDFVKVESARKGKGEMTEFLKTVELMLAQDIRQAMQKVIPNEKGVNLITCHSAKGLEFGHVFIIGAMSDQWESKVSRGSYLMPDNLNPSGSNEDDRTQEERRLFYVGMTRAKEQLSISYYAQNMEGKDVERSRFVAELEESGLCEPAKLIVKPDDVLHFEEQVLGLKIPHDPINLGRNHMTALLEDFSLSPTSLSKYLRCQRAFYYETILRIPAAKGEAMSFGTAVHHCLEELFFQMTENKGVFPDKSELIKSFEKSLWRQRSNFSEKEYQRKLEYGRFFLPDYYDHYLPKWNKNVILERKMRTVVIDNIPISGQLDKVELSDLNANVVDYKTGNYEYALKYGKFARPGEANEKHAEEYTLIHGGDYWRQAVFYRLLIEHSPNVSWKVVSTEFDFVEPQTIRKNINKEFIKHRLDILDEDVELLKKQIKEVYPRIRNFEFDLGCGNETCYWCNLEKGIGGVKEEDAG